MIMQKLEILLLMLLASASVGAVAQALEAGVQRFWRPSRRVGTVQQRLKEMLGIRGAPRITMKHAASDQPPSGVRILAELLSCRADGHRIDAAIDDLVEEFDAGLLRWCGLLTKAAPLLGLAATLLGVSCSLEEFVRHPGKPETFVHGFAIAILGTLWGVFVSLVSLATARWLRLPTLIAYRRQLHQGVRELEQAERTNSHPTVNGRQKRLAPGGVPCRAD